jgi:UDP-N-acetylglucosamine 2-epimerase (non-hydrolysing)
LNHQGADCRIVHTGQHYDYRMSQSFFKDLELPLPDYYLEAGSGTHSVQTAKIMVAFERICQRERPDWVVVVGDVNSTLACTITAKKLGVAVAHVEAGFRSFDLSMPEEINRIVTDSISDCFLVTEESGKQNLLREGKPASRVHCVGNVMIDNLFHQLERLGNGKGRLFSTRRVKEERSPYAFLTLHRPSNVDDPETFSGIAEALNEIASERAILFPVHPRTKKKIAEFGLSLSPNIRQLPPLGFREALYLWKDSEAVLTDSGGLQEETTALGVPCVTIRENTERPVTVEMGTNILAGTKKESILRAYRRSPEKRKKYTVPPLWDGRAASRVWEVLLNGDAGAIRSKTGGRNEPVTPGEVSSLSRRSPKNDHLTASGGTWK